MRIRAYVLSSIILVALPSWAAASQITFFEFLNSDLTFGTAAPDHAGRDLSSAPDGPVSAGDFLATFQANPGALVKQTLQKDTTGNVVGSTYQYGPGTFRMDFTWPAPGGGTSGSFEAGIESLTIEAAEGADGPVSATYVLGAGLFDADLAEALGIVRRGLSGIITSRLLLTDNGNRPGVGGTAFTQERQAWDGVTDAEISVPEPATTTLLLAGIAGAMTRFRKRRTRALLVIVSPADENRHR